MILRFIRLEIQQQILLNYLTSGTTPINVTSFSSAPTLEHTTIVVANVEGTFSAGEVVTGQTSNALNFTIKRFRF